MSRGRGGPPSRALSSVPPQIAGPREPHTQVSVVQDGEATLQCHATGKPPPKVTWERDGQPLTAEPGLRLQNHGQKLRVEGAQAAHSGRYSCVAENVAGRAERRFTLSVLGEDQLRTGGDGGRANQRGQGQPNLQAQPLVLPGVRPLMGPLLGEALNTLRIRTGSK